MQVDRSSYCHPSNILWIHIPETTFLWVIHYLMWFFLIYQSTSESSKYIHLQSPSPSLLSMCTAVVGKRLPPIHSHAFQWVRDWVRVIVALHHAINKVEKPSLDHPTPPFRQTSPIIISSLSFFSILFLSSSQSTISLRLLAPYASRNEASIFVASYASYRVRSPDLGFLPHRHPRTGFLCRYKQWS